VMGLILPPMTSLFCQCVSPIVLVPHSQYNKIKRTAKSVGL